MTFMTLEFEIKREKNKNAESMGFKSYTFKVKKNGKVFYQCWETYKNIQEAKKMGIKLFLRHLYDGKIKI